MEKSYNIARPYRDIYQTRLLKQAAIYQQPIFYGLPTTDSNEEGKIKMDQRKIRKALKIAKIEDNDFSYQDIADLL